MRRLRVERFLTGAALVAAAMTCVHTARADDAKAEEKAEKKEAKAEEKAEKADEKDAKADEKPLPPIFGIGLDFVVGRGSATEVTGIVPPGTTTGYAGLTTTGTTRITDYSFLLGATMKLTPGFGIGMRLPLEGGTLFVPAYQRSDGGIGNLELSAAGFLDLSDMLRLELSLGLTLPTAGGVQVPAAGAPVPITQGAIDQSGYDRYSIQRAISASRGYEDDELFQPNHLGINPKLALRIGSEGKWNFTPWVKLDDLIATNSSYSFIGELIFGANLGVFLGPIEPTVRVWANAPLTGADFSSTVAVVEPQLRLHCGDDFVAYVGGILPFAGPATNPYDYGIRVGAGLRF
jgi:hypothetical protein